VTTRNFGAPIRRNEDARLLSGQALFERRAGRNCR
jgi:hypothetical protein